MATKKVKQPVKTSLRKRVNKEFINQMSQFRGYMTGNEKTQLATLDVKNVTQRILNRAMSDNVENTFTSVENDEIQRLIKNFVKEINKIIK